MRLIKIFKNSKEKSIVRVTGIVQYNNGDTEEYWFEIPDAYEPSSSGNPWLAILLPIAATLGEDLDIPFSIDPSLFRGAESILRLWAYWRKDIKIISITTETIQTLPDQNRTSASFFSSGVDSMFTVLRRPDVKNWVTVQGFDMPVSKTEEFLQHCTRLENIAKHYNCKFIPVVTNIRETRWKEANWELISHGAALAAVGLLFENHFHEILVPASYDYTCLDPWGSHPLLDPLFSTVYTKIVHEGTAYTRTEKIKYISEDKKALSELHVCYRGADSKGQDSRNCGRCEKCYRTMIALDLLGKLDDATLFDRSNFDVKRISKIYISHDLDKKFFINLHSTSVELKRYDIAKQILIAMKRSSYIKKLDFFSNLTFFWRPAQSLSKYFLRDSPK